MLSAPTTPEAWLDAAIARLRAAFDARGVELGDVHADPACSVPAVVDRVRALEFMAHDLVHVATGRGHGRDFIETAAMVGLVGRSVATLTPDFELGTALRAVAADLGPLPAPAGALKASQIWKPLPIECSRCHARIRASVNTLLRAGTPTCGCGGRMRFALTCRTRGSRKGDPLHLASSDFLPPCPGLEGTDARDGRSRE